MFELILVGSDNTTANRLGWPQKANYRQTKQIVFSRGFECASVLCLRSITEVGARKFVRSKEPRTQNGTMCKHLRQEKWKWLNRKKVSLGEFCLIRLNVILKPNRKRILLILVWCRHSNCYRWLFVGLAKNVYQPPNEMVFVVSELGIMTWSRYFLVLFQIGCFKNETKQKNC